MKETIIDIEQLSQDAHNFNRGTEEGRELMQRSLQQLGAGRSILIDKDNNIIAGNKTQEAARKAGIRRVRIIETSGDELVAVKRTDIDIDSAKGRELALVDNLATQINLQWDEAQLETITGEVEGFDPDSWGWEPPTFEGGEGSQQKDPTNSELDVDDFGDKIKMTLEFSIEEHAFIQQALQRDGMTKEQVLLQLLGYGTD